MDILANLSDLGKKNLQVAVGQAAVILTTA